MCRVDNCEDYRLIDWRRSSGGWHVYTECSEAPG